MFEYLNKLSMIFKEDERILREKEKTYQGSWKKRGGVGAFMMLARKWDRLENILSSKFHYDIFDGIEEELTGKNDDSVLAQIQDLRRYLGLVEAEVLQRKTDFDNKIESIKIPFTNPGGQITAPNYSKATD